MKLSRAQFFAVFFFCVLLILAAWPFTSPGAISSDDYGFSLILFVIGLTYLLSIFVPVWKKAAIMSDGVVILLTAFIFFSDVRRIIFSIFGVCLIVLAVLAYTEKLPAKLLKYFYE